jgi:Zn-dependent protease
MLISVFTFVVLILSIVIHEVAHGSVALSLGDRTAKEQGRLSLNPIKHVDPFGTILLPLLLYMSTMGRGPIIGWAKPVPVNPFNFKDQRWGELKVSLAGPASNLTIALVFGLSIRFLNLSPELLPFFGIITIYNILLAVFNLVPIPPLDGSHILFAFLPESFSAVKIFLNRYQIFIFLAFIFIGLQPVYFLTQIVFNLICGS